jgi:hypothetical protein
MLVKWLLKTSWLAAVLGNPLRHVSRSEQNSWPSTGPDPDVWQEFVILGEPAHGHSDQRSALLDADQSLITVYFAVPFVHHAPRKLLE